MIWIIIAIVFALYVIYSLSVIKHQLKLISKHLNIRENQTYQVSNDEIEKELEDDLKG